jgi:hypothetical protein
LQPKGRSLMIVLRIANLSFNTGKVHNEDNQVNRKSRAA